MAEKSTDSKTSLDGIELFKSEVTKVLLAEKDCTLEICHFKLAYKKIFRKHFNHEKFGFTKKKLTSYFDDISDIVSFKNERSLIELKENKPTPNQGSRKDARQTNKTTSKTGKTTSKSGTDVKEKQLVSLEPPQPLSDGSLSGSDRFKAEVKEILQDKANCKVEVGQFVHLYKHKFKALFDPTSYGFQKRAKVSALLGAIPDVVLLERIGSSLYMKLNNRSSLPNMVQKETSHDVCTGIETSADAASHRKSISDSARMGSKHNKHQENRSGTERSSGQGLSGLPTSDVYKSLPHLPSSVNSNNCRDRNTLDIPHSELECYPKHLVMKNKPLSVQANLVAGNSPYVHFPYLSSVTTGLPAATMTTGFPAATTTGPPAGTMTTGPPAATTTGPPAGTMTTGLPAATMTTGLPTATMTTGLPAATMTTGLPAATMTTGLPAATMTTGLPAATRTTGLPTATMTTGLPAATMTTGLPAATMTTGLPAATMTTGLPAATRTTGLPTATMTTGLPAATMTTGLPAATMTTGLPTASKSGSSSSSKMMDSSVPSFSSIMLDQEKELSLEESFDFKGLSSTPSTMAKPRNSRMRNPCHDADDEQLCLDSPSPFEESFISTYDTPLGISSLAKDARRMSTREINEIAKQVCQSISDDDEHVTLERVKFRLCKKLGVKKLSELGYRRPDIDIPALKELSRLLCKLDLYARAYVMVHSISTITELGQGMARLMEKKDFLDLQVGPLVKLPVVYDLFKAPSDDVIVQRVTTVHILKHLNQYLTKNDRWTRKVDLHDFMQYLCDTYQCDSPYELGVRIQSIGLGISVLKRAQKSQSEKSKHVEQELADDMEREIEKRCKKMKDDLLGSSHGDERSLIHKLLGSSVIDIITRVFYHCQEVFKPRPFKKVSKFLTIVTSDKSSRDLFHLSLHMGCKDIVREVLEDYKAELLEEAKRLDSGAQETTSPPNKRTLLKEAKDWLNGAENLDLSTMETIEKRLLNRFPGFDVFSSFGYGTWLEFLNGEKELCTLLENKGASVCGGTKSTTTHQVDLNSLLDFVVQCGSRTTEDMVQRALCNHYHIPSVTALGVQNCKTLMEQSNQRKHVEQSVIYELAIVCKDGDPNALQHLHASTIEEAKPRAGILGWKKVDDAVRALGSAPLLADMKEWTQWDAVFKPCLGDLKQFIAQAALKKRTDGIQLQALETEERKLLKINTNTNPDDLKKAIDENNVIGTAGILVSLVIKYGGIQATPLALIINHIKPALLALACLDQADDGKRCPRFVLHCLCRLPRRICAALASKVFLEPFGAAVGTTLSNQLLLSCCDTTQQRCCLHQLGLTLGHTEWIEDFNSMIAGETSNQIWEEERRKLLEDLRPVAVVKPVTAAESVKQEKHQQQEEEKDIIVQQEVILVEEQPNQPSSTGETAATRQGETRLAANNKEEEHEEDTSEQNPCKALIESIRRAEFGIGVTLGEEENKLVQKQREREGRSLHRLSSELYSKDTHFVLELIQNADDNTFTTDPPTLPTLVFIIEPEVVIVVNNEVGFKEDNIRALCDVGKSTKGAHQYGYIGQKGIGFKSVFRVSDRPEVHSNGYHIRFDANSGPSGYILPHWIDDHDVCSHSSTAIADLHLDSWMTRIVLPLKDEFHGDKKNPLSARFNDVHPSLLLFLHRLRKIVLAKKNKVQQMTRQDLCDGIIQITDTHGQKRWLVVKKQLKVLEAKENVEMTELALAFPMAEGKTSSNEIHATPFPVQNVFAYLPLRSYGFKFIIQGDFEVPSSREDVDADKAWNQWLREQIPGLFVDALEVLKNHPHFPGLSGVATFFHFVPLKEEILDFFNPVAEMILRHLQGKNCLPVKKTVDEDVNSASGVCQYEWRQPCEVVVCEDPDVMALISPDLLFRHLALHYLVPDLISAINPALREELGIQTLSVQHLIDVAGSVIKDYSSMKENEKRILWISKWLCCVYRCLEREHISSSQILDQIAALHIFPLSDCTFVNLRDNAIFFPLSINQQTMKEKKKRSTAKYLQALEKDLLVLNPELLNHLDSVEHSQVEKLLQHLGVKSWTAKDVIHNHILPTLKSDKWKTKTSDVLQCYVVYIFKEHLVDPILCDLDELKECAQVLTNKGPINPSKTPVYFTMKYGNHLNLSKDLPEISWTLINDSYLDETQTSTARQEWEKFFSALGVQHFLIIKRKRVTLNKMTLDSSPWASYYDSWPKTPDSTYVIDDFCCDELNEFMRNERVDAKQAKVLAENLDKRWKDHYSTYADKLPLQDSDGKELGHSTLPSFILAIKTRDWLPVKQSSTCSIPGNLYLHSKEVYDVLDDHVQYVDANLQPDSSFARVLGVSLDVKLDNLLDTLKGWSQTCQSSLFDQAFATSPAHMRRVYQFIYEKYQTSTGDDQSKITSAFQKYPLIFFPRDPYFAKEKEDQKRMGKFYHKKEVCWKDPSCVAEELVKSSKYTAKRRLLSTCYRKYYDFFIRCLKVDVTPHSDEYIEMAFVLTSENPVPTPSVLENMIEIFAVLGEKCLTRSLTETDYTSVDRANYVHTEPDLEKEEIDPAFAKYLKSKLAKEDIFPCDARWVCLSEKPIVADNKRLKKVFDEENGVHFIALEQQRSRRCVKQGHEKKMAFVQVFLRACGIPKLSACVEKKLIPKKVVFDQCHEVQQYLHQIVPCIQRYIYHKLPELHDMLVKDNFPQMLANMTFAMVDKLEIVYHLTHLPQVTVAQEAKWGHEKPEDAIFLYGVKNQLEIAQPLNQEIANLFSGASGMSLDKKFENFIDLLQVNLEKNLESFLLDQDADSLPDEEVKWYVPAPEIPKTPEIVEEEIPEPLLAGAEASSREYEDDGTLHCWPPRAPVTRMPNSCPPENRAQEKAVETWPVPEAPASMTPDDELPGNETTAGGAVYTHALGPERTLRSQCQQNTTLKDQPKTVEPHESVPKETTHPLLHEAAAQPREQYSHLHSTPPVEIFPIFTPDMQVDVQDLEFENIPTEDISLSDIHVIQQNPNKNEIGRWGEQFVYEYLKCSLQTGEVDVQWKNELQNSVAPYDIEIRKRSNGAEEITFIEVKSTSGDGKEHFEISAAEIQFALQQEHRFHLYRVFNAGSREEVRIQRAINLAAHLERKSVKLFMIM